MIIDSVHSTYNGDSRAQSFPIPSIFLSPPPFPQFISFHFLCLSRIIVIPPDIYILINRHRLIKGRPVPLIDLNFGRR